MHLDEEPIEPASPRLPPPFEWVGWTPPHSDLRGLASPVRFVSGARGACAPCDRLAAPSAKAERVTKESSAPRRPRPLVLIVDDFDDNRAMYAEFLRYSGLDVIEASDGAEAIEKTTSMLPDVVVMDLSLPVVDGWEATRRIKEDARTRHVPILALTGHALEGHSVDARNAGCDGFLAKPCLPELLLETVQAMLSRPRPGQGRDITRE
jgi:two-component system cell cycle response regulator DivK